MKGNPVHSYLSLAYVAMVTAVLLALIAEQSSRGPAALPGLAVYALTAGFGLEYVSSSWARRRRRGDGPALSE